MIERLLKSLTTKNYSLLGVELVVVIVGILIAFQIERWGEQKQEREQEYEYLLRLKEDLQIENGTLDAAYRFAQSRIDAALVLEEIAANPSVARERPSAVASALETVTWRSFPQIEAFLYSELQNSGKLAVIRSESLRRNLANHYTSIRNYSRAGLDRDASTQFERLTAGILTTDELRAIEDQSWSGESRAATPDRAAEITDELLKRQGAIEWIPNIAQHHVFNQKVILESRDQATEIIAQIDSLIVQFDE